MAPVIQRRSLLRLLAALAPAGVLLAAARPAAALRPVLQGDAAGLLDDACGASAYHARLIDDALQRIGLTLTDQQRAQLLGGIACPTCRCPLSAFDTLAGGPAF